MKLLTGCLLFTACLLALRAAPEPPAVRPVDPTLTTTIAELDARLFAAFNAADLATAKEFLAPDLEFYHDKDGVSGYDQTVAALDRLSTKPSAPQRTLLPDTLEVYPIKDFGAVQIAAQRFCVVEDGRTSCSTYKFIHLWRQRDGKWQLVRVISVGH